MGSFARRRVINVDVEYIEELKKIMKRMGANTATGAASMIFSGSAPPLTNKVVVSGKKKGVSMTEAMWLSIRKRSEDKGKATTVVVQELISGIEPALTEAELDFGRIRANDREQRRAAGNPEEGIKIPDATHPPVRITHAEPEKVEVEKVESKTEGKSTEKTHPSVKEMLNDKSEARKKARANLSKGHKVKDQNGDSRGFENVPLGESHYGGVFSL